MDIRSSLIKSALFLFFVFSLLKGYAQTDDILWASFQLRTKVSDKTVINFKPIFRFNNELSTYQNMSIDVTAKHQLGKGWSTQLLARTWFIPDQKERQFLWLDIAHAFNFKAIKISNRLRYHWALDINDRNDPDFLRWSTQFSIPSKGKLTPFINIEPWWRLNKQNQFQRIRYEPGINYKFNKTYGLTLLYRREESINFAPKVNTNFWVVNLLIVI